MVLDIRLSCFILIVYSAAFGSGISQNGGCSSATCQAGKTCIVLESGASYCNNCTNGKIGKNCNAIDPCLRNGSCSSNEECQAFINATGIVSSTCLTKSCDLNTCHNRGTCYQDGNGFARCMCNFGWQGRYCTEDVDECLNSLCQNSATCKNLPGSFYCLCMYGFEGSLCEKNIDDCVNQPCMNNGTCVDLVAAYTCICTSDKTGLRCQDNNPCKSNPCHAGSVCSADTNQKYSCSSCPKGLTGENCDQDENECENESGICEQGGECINTYGSYYCNCTKGTEGLRCEQNINHCASSPCHNEGTCLWEPETFKCICMDGYSGDTCEDRAGCGISCNGGRCVDDGDSFKCNCPSNTTGQFCEYDLHGVCLTNSCSTKSCTVAEAKLCQNSGECKKSVNGSTCECRPGFQGQYCQIDICIQNPCKNNGACQRSVSGRTCNCSENFVGESCEIVNLCSQSPCLNGGSCQPIDSPQNYICTCLPSFAGSDCERKTLLCDSNPCGSGGTCQEESGKFKCICKTGMAGSNCKQDYCVFNKCSEKEGNGRCDKECNVTLCNYDGGDCAKRNNPYKDCAVLECPNLFKNGRCDSKCKSESCLWDGFDCDMTPLVCPNISYCGPRFQNGHCDKECFNAPCRYDGTDCTSNTENVQGQIVLQLLTTKEIFIQNMEQFLYNLSTQLTCTVKVATNPDGSSIVNVVDIPKYGSGIEVYLKLVYIPPAPPCFTILSKALDFFNKETENGTINGIPVTSVKSVSDPPGTSEDTPPTFIILGAVFAVLLVVVILGVGYWKRKKEISRTWLPPGFRRNRSPADQMSSGSEKNIVDKCDSFSENSFNTDTFPKSSKGEFSDCGTVVVPTFPANQIVKSSQYVRNMINNQFNYPQNAVRPGLNRPFQDDIFTRLINEATRFYKETGETPLHLAARYSRADAAQKFLEDGADPNAQDNNGKTPLHAAIGADAVGVFQILLRCRTCSVNVQMKDGTTPLIYAVRLAIDGMVGDLIKAEADLNKTDDQGKTGLHWAAAVNNLDAAILLLHHGGLNRDAQDDKGQTPLFLAAKEGSFNVAQLLLHNSASMDLADQLDRLPRDIAIEKRHFDIVKLLDDYSSHANQSRAYSNYSDHLLTTENGRSMKHKKATTSHEPDGGGRNRKKRKIEINEIGSEQVSSSQPGMCGLNYQQHPRGYENSPYFVNSINNPYHELQQWNKQNANNFIMNDPIKAKHLKGLQKKNNMEKHLIGSTGSSPSDSDFTVSPKEGSNGSPGYCNNGIVFVSSSEPDHYHQQIMFGSEGIPKPVPAAVIQRYPSGMKHSQHLQTFCNQYDELYQDQAQFSKSSNVSSSSYYNIPSQQIILQQYPTPPSHQFSPNNVSAPVGTSCTTATQRENLFETPSPGSGDQFVEASITCDAPIRQHNDMTAVYGDSSVC